MSHKYYPSYGQIKDDIETLIEDLEEMIKEAIKNDDMETRERAERLLERLKIARRKT